MPTRLRSALAFLLAWPLFSGVAPGLAPAAASAPAAFRGGDELRPGELVEGELGFQLDEFLSGLEGLGFAGIVGVEQGGQPILLRGYGLAERETGRPVTPATVFDIGSITKQFTAAAILALQEEGKLSVQDPLTKHFADVPADKRGITLHHLLTHTSGLEDPPLGDHDPRATAEWVRDFALDCELAWPPGAEYGYRNVNFSLLGMVIERVSGEPYETYLRRRLFARAKLEHTGYLQPRFAPESLAVGYRDGERWGTTLERAMLADGPSWTLRANGGIHSTVGDMLRWHHALAADRVLTPASRALLETPFADEGGGTSYGYGWSIDRSPGGKKLVAHNGGNGVFFADFLRYVEEGHCVFVATGVGSRVRPTLAYELAGLLFGRAPRAVPSTLPVDAAFLARYAGRYPLSDESYLELRSLGDRLVLGGEGPDAFELLCDERTRARLAEARALTAAVCAGDDQPLLGAYRGGQSPASIRAELAEARARWRAALGAFRELGASAARPDEDTRLLTEARFERGSAFLVASWGPAGRLFAFECLDAAPFAGAPPTELFPLSPTLFRAYDDRSGLGLAVEFELDPAGRATELRLGEPPIGLQRE